MSNINLVYLCGPIDMDTNQGGKPWREKAIVLLKGIGVSSFSPAHAFGWCPGDTTAARKMYTINRQAIKNSDAILVYVNPEVHTVGSYMEVQQATDFGKHVIVFSNNLSNTTNKIAYLSQIPQFDSLYAAIQYINQLK